MLGKLQIINGNLIFSKEIIKCNILIDNGKISSITDKFYDDLDTIDAKNMYVSPGFIDIHIHGTNGYDTMDGTFKSVDGISLSLVKHGVTSFLPTTMTAPKDMTIKAIKNVKNAMQMGTDGATVEGIHMEGPFISPHYKGAQPEEYILNPSVDNFNLLTDGNDDIVKNITIAPELPGAFELSRYLNEKGVNVSLGHTDADYSTVKAASLNGFSHATHTFNGMKGFHHRQPGTLGAIMDIEDLTCEVICDGVHSMYPSIRILLKCKGVDNTLLVTDSMMAGDLKDGQYTLGTQNVNVKNGEARLSDGTLAGSTLSIDRAIYNVIRHCNVSLCDAVKMASANPAKKINLKRKGSLMTGYDADLTIFDGSLNIYYTLVNGSVKYKRI